MTGLAEGGMIGGQRRAANDASVGIKDLQQAVSDITAEGVHVIEPGHGKRDRAGPEISATGGLAYPVGAKLQAIRFQAARCSTGRPQARSRMAAGDSLGTARAAGAMK